ncbi:UDP-3-O-(3-hydroxymyristoyl) glucosamine N-acyltransferase [Oceanicola sp. 22II-s10i]|uniref:UDP-3-O-(3-hydroxymyristoyl)glucosamine N-acyltransferase n=1 Tax=Oceanicola sp. 22II-s10i TaxID=1317116 RepID=UPI000B525E3E|nr:UDP-3-O-(3-hydroxymyristoyl)glucosamine N-acyltransferase [Oceanicola sp. 22II-s10i]OWU83564.1 UDP-3-O-(3-hydroxymyristoyl) glucosamine N-acyltransferase [Oceanicola sp. 22II-s10i]
MPHSIADIAAALGAVAVGDTSLTVEAATSPATAGPGDLAVALGGAHVVALCEGAARAAILPDGTDWAALGLDAAILLPVGRETLHRITAHMDRGQGHPPGIHAGAVIDPTARIGAGVSIGPFAVIGPGARIGAGTIIADGVHVGPEACIGADTVLHPHVRIGARVRIGDRFIAQPGATVGFDGFSFTTLRPSQAEQARTVLASPDTPPDGQPWLRVHSLASVEIGADVELGANTCVDSGTLAPTRIGSGTKIDNLCHIAHNVTVGDDCLFAAMVGIAGSCRIGNNVVLGGKVGVSDHVSVGDHVVAGGGSVILSTVPAGRVMLGYPATRIETQVESYKAMRRLPRLIRRIERLQKSVFKSEQKD